MQMMGRVNKMAKPISMIVDEEISLVLQKNLITVVLLQVILILK